MTGKVLDVSDILYPDALAQRITDYWITWDNLRQPKKRDWEEVRRYVFATDTRQTTNSQNPWKNSTTIPKLCQIADNLYSNYTATMFPQRKWLIWEANERDSNEISKRDAITNYMGWVISQPSFKHEIDKIILDYIHYGNCIVTVDWLDQRQNNGDYSKTGYVGPVARRISPLDIVFNPTAENFISAPKIIRSITSMSEIKEHLERQTNDDNRAELQALFDYLKKIRSEAQNFQGEWVDRDNQYAMEGYSSFRDYLLSDAVEVLTFYGDVYDRDEDTLLKNYVITVVDRHKMIGKKVNPSYFGYPPIFHAPWRKRQDNLWGMGPLDNLVGMQYRMDHIENMKADVVDFVTFPVIKIKGYVQDFRWQPGAQINIDEEGDVGIETPDTNALQMNSEIGNYSALMEEMAGAPKEAMGFRTPGEKTKYEVQRLENAASRVFQNKIRQFEEQVIEPLLNAMLELARRNLTGTTTIKVFDDEFQAASFVDLTAEDITGMGRIKPVAARHFAEQAQTIQDLTNLAGSPLWQIVAPHVSGKGMAKFFENTLNIGDYGLIQPWIALAEQTEAQKQAHAYEEQLVQHTSTATGMGEDFDLSAAQGMQMPMGPPQQPTEPGALPQ